jgi:hypothetical protein
MHFSVARNGWGEPILAALGPTGILQRCIFLPFIPDSPIAPFHGVCARFLISSEENRYGYDYRSGDTGD